MISDLKENGWKKGSVAAVGLAVAMLAAVLAPLYVIALYNYPCADDFSFAAFSYRAYKAGEGLPGMIKASFESAAWFYKIWQGRYSDNLAYSLGLGTAVPKWYFLGTWIILTFFALACLTVFTKVLMHLFQMPKGRAFIAGGLFTAFTVMYIPYPQQAFFWYLGATSYTGTFSCFIIAVYCIWRISGKDRGASWKHIAATAVCIAVIAGSNYSTALLIGEVLVIFLILEWLHKRKGLFHLLLLAEFGILFSVNVLDPANKTRMGEVELMGPMESILASFRQSAAFTVEWFHVPVFLLMAAVLWLSLPYLKNVRKYPLPGLYSLATFCLFTSMLTPPFYAGGTWGPGRLINTVYVFYLFMLCSNVIYWAGWIGMIFERKRGSVSDGKLIRCFGEKYLPVFMVVMAVCMLGCLKYYGLQSVSSTSATLSILKGEAARYRAENEIRWAMYEDETLSDIVVPDFSVKPYVLYHDDIDTDPSDWRNVVLADFFGKASVRRE